VLGGGAEDRDVDVVDLLVLAEAVVDGHHEAGAGLAGAVEGLRVAGEVALQGDAVLADHFLNPPVGQWLLMTRAKTRDRRRGDNLDSRFSSPVAGAPVLLSAKRLARRVCKTGGAVTQRAPASAEARWMRILVAPPE